MECNKDECKKDGDTSYTKCFNVMYNLELKTAGVYRTPCECMTVYTE
jgi:hypothetical protein